MTTRQGVLLGGGRCGKCGDAVSGGRNFLVWIGQAILYSMAVL